MINPSAAKKYPLSCALLCVFSTLAFAQLSEKESEIVSLVDAGNPDALALLQQVVEINSGTMNFEGVAKVGSVFSARLDALGFETRWIDGASFERAGHLYAERAGTGPTILLIGHLDTVFEPDSPFQSWSLVSDSVASGPGVADMKGGDVIIVKSLEALLRADVLDDLHVIVVMTGDEERSGRPLDEARRALVDAAEQADIAIGFENGDGDPATAVVARRSSSSWRLNVEGKPAHSSQVFTDAVGAGAIYEASRILAGFYSRLSTIENLTFNPGLILGGTDVEYDQVQARGSAFGKSNVVAGKVVVTGDLRAISPSQIELAKSGMQEIVAAHLPLTNATLEFSDGYPPLAPTDGNYDLLGEFSEVSVDLGFGPVAPVDPRKAGAADISFTAGHVTMAMDGIGLGGADDHTVNETGYLWTLPMQTKRAAVLLYRLSQRVAN